MELEDIKLSNLKGNLDVTIEFEEVNKEITSEQAINKMAQDVIKGLYGSGTARKENLYKAIQSEVNKITQ